MTGTIAHLSDASFDDALGENDIPLLVDFWADWCGPCKAIAPILEDLAVSEAARLRVAKLNIDDNLDVTRRYEVLSIPTLILFKKGRPAVRIVGAKSRTLLLEEIRQHL